MMIDISKVWSIEIQVFRIYLNILYLTYEEHNLSLFVFIYRIHFGEIFG